MSTLHRINRDPKFEEDEDGVCVTLNSGTDEIYIHLSWNKFIRAVEGGRRFIAERERNKAPVFRLPRRRKPGTA